MPVRMRMKIKMRTGKVQLVNSASTVVERDE
jgi:hypothetical protein